MVKQSVTEMLEQGIKFLKSLTLDQYTESIPEAYGASLGGHYRHIINHVEVLIAGLDDDLVDYDARQRDKSVETDLEIAKSRTQDLLTVWNELTDQDMHKDINVICKTSYANNTTSQVVSSIGREAMYVTIHAVHHFALIGVICNLRDITMVEGFGIAPSTIKAKQDETELAKA